ncbi:MAG: hypothetical protein QNK04_18370 [Myxococcota bacterium]|nr:hypothetical protein [Myxococcota bacterium]
MQHERIRRPKPERKDPIRGGTFSLFGAPESAGPEEPGATEESAADPVARAVDIGYRVVDDYLRQGQKAARLMAKKSYGPEALANDVQELTAGLMQYGAELMDLWMQLLGQAATGQAKRPSGEAGAGGKAPGPSTEGSPPAPPRPDVESRPTGSRPVSRVALAVQSPHSTEVDVELDARAGQALIVQELQNPKGGPPIRGATLEGGERPRLHLVVAPDQPVGTYCGLVLDAATSLPVGNVVVRVLPTPVPGAPRP